MGRLKLAADLPSERLLAAEFFAGIGLVRLGLDAAGFTVIWSNDVDPGKCEMYGGHFQDKAHHRLVEGDIATVDGASLPDRLSLAWASFPCIDLSLAGWRRGLDGLHSATFWHFTRILGEMGVRRPPVVALENVVGLATSHGGADLASAIRELNHLGYSVDVLTLDARRFVPQSRPRLFLIGVQNPPTDESSQPNELRPTWLQTTFSESSLTTHRATLPPPPPLLTSGLSSIVEPLPDSDERWWDEVRTASFLDSLSKLQAKRLDLLLNDDAVRHRTAYRRTRRRISVWEIRSDDVSGCLRTTRGGSSKQALVQAGRGKVRVRWMTPREYARLMGAPDYMLAGVRNNQLLFGFGDAVCVPVVRWLAENYLRPHLTGWASETIHQCTAANA